ncbi:MAG TPA: hypothetical protein VK689_15590, partial [Armatimonadota bacterium]|nr:hypothetical protein [Armatimonadota bacterium]
MSYLKTIGSWLRHAITVQLASLRGRLLFTLVGLLLVLLLLEGTQHASRLGTRREELALEHKRAAESAAGIFRRNLDRLYAQQGVIARLLLRDQISVSRAFAHLEDLSSQYEGLVSVQVYDTSGVVRYAYPRTNVLSVVGEPFFRSLGKL